MERHVALVAAAEIMDDVLGPLICLRQEHPVLEMSVHVPAKLPDNLMGFVEVFVVGALTFAEVGHGIQPQAVHAQAKPEIQDLGD